MRELSDSSIPLSLPLLSSRHTIPSLHTLTPHPHHTQTALPSKPSRNNTPSTRHKQQQSTRQQQLQQQQPHGTSYTTQVGVVPTHTPTHATHTNANTTHDAVETVHEGGFVHPCSNQHEVDVVHPPSPTTLRYVIFFIFLWSLGIFVIIRNFCYH